MSINTAFLIGHNSLEIHPSVGHVTNSSSLGAEEREEALDRQIPCVLAFAHRRMSAIKDYLL